MTATSVLCLFTGKPRTLRLCYFIPRFFFSFHAILTLYFGGFVASGFVLEVLASAMSCASKTWVGSLFISLDLLFYLCRHYSEHG